MGQTSKSAGPRATAAIEISQREVKSIAVRLSDSWLPDLDQSNSIRRRERWESHRFMRYVIAIAIYETSNKQAFWNLYTINKEL